LLASGAVHTPRRTINDEHTVRALLASAAVYAAVGGVPVAATTEPPGTPAGEATEESLAAPVAVTASIDPGDYVGPPATQERVDTPSSEDAMMTLARYRGDTYIQPWTEVSDPRLEGTYTRSWDEDEYFQGPAFLSVVVTTDRIENDEGAWQGSSVWYRPAQGEPSIAPMVMVGEGAYEGLTAILGGVEAYGECAVTGYIIEGSIPAPPVPPSDQ
jgi:hypothetical protein